MEVLPTTNNLLTQPHVVAELTRQAYIYNGNTVSVVQAYSPAGTCGGNRYGCACNYESSWEDPGYLEDMICIQTEQDGQPGFEIHWKSVEYNPPQIVACDNTGCCPNNGKETTPTTFSTEPIGQVFVPCGN